MTLHIKVVSPEKVVLDIDADEVVAPTTSGEIAILSNHVPLVTQLDHGELIIKHNGKETSLAVTGGFLEVSHNQISVLADYAIRSEDIEVAKAEEARRRAEKLLEEKKTDRDFAEAQSIMRRAILELKIANKKRHYRSGPPTT